MLDALDLHRGNGRSWKRPQQHASQRVAQGRAEPAFKGLDDELRVPSFRLHHLELGVGRRLAFADRYFKLWLDPYDHCRIS